MGTDIPMNRRGYCRGAYIMIKPRNGEMNYEKIDELAFYYMFVAACLPEEEVNQLKEAWHQQGGHQGTPWWKFVMENTKVSIDLN